MALITAALVTMIAKRNGVPDHLIDGVAGYVTLGHRPGSFLLAVFENDLFEAVRRADPVSSAGLVALACFIDNSLPAACHGSRERVAAWIAHGGMRQFETADKAGV